MCGLHIDYRLVIAGHETADIQEENATTCVYLAVSSKIVAPFHRRSSSFMHAWRLQIHINAEPFPLGSQSIRFLLLIHLFSFIFVLQQDERTSSFG